MRKVWKREKKIKEKSRKGCFDLLQDLMGAIRLEGEGMVQEWPEIAHSLRVQQQVS